MDYLLVYRVSFLHPGARKSTAQETQNNKVTDEEFPTMRDALNMSRGIKAKPKVKKDKQEKEQAEKGNLAVQRKSHVNIRTCVLELPLILFKKVYWNLPYK